MRQTTVSGPYDETESSADELAASLVAQLRGKTVLFCAIFEITVLMVDMARKLRTHGCNVVWTATHRTWLRYLRDQGEPESSILDLRIPKSLRPADVPVEEAVLAEIRLAEQRLDMTLASIYMMDRFTMDMRQRDGWRYLVRYYRELRTFLGEKHVDLVIGEPTQATDLMTYFVATTLGIPYYQIASIRIPSARSAICRGVAERAVCDLPESVVEDDRPDAAMVIRAVSERGEKPLWFAKNNVQRIFKWTDAPGLLRNLRHRLVDDRRSVDYRIRSRIWDRFRRVAFRRYARSFLQPTELAAVPRPFALYALQVQPERSVDVIAPFASNQLEVIRSIRRSLPAGMALVIKEHSNLIGGRGPDFFREVRRLPDTYVVSPYLDSHRLIAESALVISVSGTICFEAALAGVPAVTFAELFFSSLSTAFTCSNARELPSVIERALGATHDPDADRLVIERLIRDSLPCFLGNAVDDPRLRDAANVDALVRLVIGAVWDAGGRGRGAVARAKPSTAHDDRASYDSAAIGAQASQT